MLFNSWEFLVLLVCTLLLYYLPLPGRRVWQVGLLLCASGIFYAWGNVSLLILLGVSCLFNSFATERILHWKFGVREENQARLWLIAAVSLNLILLAFFKYAGFLISLVPDGLVSHSFASWIRGVPLPVGISFYTFQGISLLVDVWRKDLGNTQMKRLQEKGLGRINTTVDLSFFIAFFPQLVAGPIVKARDFIGQIGGKSLSRVHWVGAIKALILGYFLKLVVADNLAEQTAVLTAPWITNMGPIDLWFLLYGYSLQIFSDFAGYSLIAIGLASLFGYRLPTNFNFPYLATSITEFWKRWHLSLSSWLRDYLYIPLGGNRKGNGRTYFNLFLVMFLGGLWHGAAWKFAIWGSLHGVLLAIERLIDRRKAKLALPVGIKKFLGWFYTFHAVTLLWLTFLMPDMASIGRFFNELTIAQGIHGPPVFVCILFGSFAVLYHIFGWIAERRPDLHVKYHGSYLEGVVYGVLAFLALTCPGAPQGFIYFQF